MRFIAFFPSDFFFFFSLFSETENCERLIDSKRWLRDLSDPLHRFFSSSKKHFAIKCKHRKGGYCRIAHKCVLMRTAYGPTFKYIVYPMSHTLRVPSDHSFATRSICRCNLTPIRIKYGLHVSFLIFFWF